MKLMVFGRDGADVLRGLPAALAERNPRWATDDWDLRALQWIDAPPPQEQDSPILAVNDLFPGDRADHQLTMKLPDVDDTDGDAVRVAIAELVPNALAMQVTEHVALDGPVPSGGLCRGTLQVPREGQTTDEFWAHWTGVHAPLVISLGPGFVRYVTNRVIAPDLPWDGTVEQWFPSPEALAEHDRQVFNTKPAVRADLPNFMSRLQQYIGTLVS